MITRRCTTKIKYDSTSTQDNLIIERVNELANNYIVSMTEVALSWLETKVISPIVGATKKTPCGCSVNSVDLKLTDDDFDYLEELYVPHKLVGVMADNNKKIK